MNASLAPAAIAPQNSPSPGVTQFLKKKPRLLIGGEWVDAKSSQSLAVYDPATGIQIASIADASAADVDRAVAAARNALEQGPWAEMLPNQREALIWKLSDLIDQHEAEL
ncbi:MAG: aldehyde dehydrogenase family protein, partial [Steroidobacterales bacterium]